MTVRVCGGRIRQNRLYARGSALMLAETWRCTLAAIRAEQSLLASQSAVA